MQLKDGYLQKNFLKSNLGLEFRIEKEEVLLTHDTGGDGFYVVKLLRL